MTLKQGLSMQQDKNINEGSPIVWEIPIKTVSEANKSEHWSVSSKRHQSQQYFIRRQFLVDPVPITLPCTIKLVRLSSRFLDKEDNLPMSFKWIRDEISECIFPEKGVRYVDKKGQFRTLKGRADDSPLIRWEYDQEKSKTPGIRIEIQSTSPEQISDSTSREILKDYHHRQGNK